MNKINKLDKLKDLKDLCKIDPQKSDQEELIKQLRTSQNGWVMTTDGFDIQIERRN